MFDWIIVDVITVVSKILFASNHVFPVGKSKSGLAVGGGILLCRCHQSFSDALSLRSATGSIRFCGLSDARSTREGKDGKGPNFGV